MRIILLNILSFLLLFSCANNSEGRNEELLYESPVEGNWTIVRTNITSCNICPTIGFHPGGEGCYTNTLGEIFNFNWVLKSDSIEIFQLEDSRKISLEEGGYKVVKYNKNKIELLSKSRINNTIVKRELTR